MSSTPSDTEIAGILLFLATVAGISYSVKQALNKPESPHPLSLLQVKGNSANVIADKPKTPRAPNKDTLSETTSMKGRVLEE
jgi:hypothetical protein